MRASLLVSALLSAASVSAMPTIFSRTETCAKSPSDGRAATIFKQQNFGGDKVAADYTPLSANAGCFDLSSLYGAWEDQTRSLAVNQGYKCEFYTEYDCPATNQLLCLGETGQQTLKKTLPADFDKKIRSVSCRKL